MVRSVGLEMSIGQPIGVPVHLGGMDDMDMDDPNGDGSEPSRSSRCRLPAPALEEGECKPAWGERGGEPHDASDVENVPVRRGAIVTGRHGPVSGCLRSRSCVTPLATGPVTGWLARLRVRGRRGCDTSNSLQSCRTKWRVCRRGCTTWKRSPPPLGWWGR